MKNRRNTILLWAMMAQPLFTLNAQTVEHISGANNRFRVEYSDVKDSPQLVLIKAAMDRQIEMVTEVGLPDSILAFFKSIPIIVVPGKQTFAGLYLASKEPKRIEIAANFLINGRKPALLHELLHAYHDQKIPQGFHNRQVEAYFKRAKQLNAYDPKSHMMENLKEYFASTGTAYLFGVTELELFTREKLRKNQPAFYKYLQGLFGPDAGNYRGSLDERIELLKQAKAKEQPAEKNGE